MNIFYLNEDPGIAAQEHNDKHCVKMIVEYAQMLSTAHRECNGNGRADGLSLYRKTHVNHPSTAWTRDNEAQYTWLYQLFVALATEYTYRYEKTHSTDSLLRVALELPPTNIAKNKPFRQPPQCMPEEYKCDDTVEAYRNFYIGEKAQFSRWTKREVPRWFVKAHGKPKDSVI
jgi:hypothetical protein